MWVPHWQCGMPHQWSKKLMVCPENFSALPMCQGHTIKEVENCCSKDFTWDYVAHKFCVLPPMALSYHSHTVTNLKFLLLQPVTAAEVAVAQLVTYLVSRPYKFLGFVRIERARGALAQCKSFVCHILAPWEVRRSLQSTGSNCPSILRWGGDLGTTFDMLKGKQKDFVPDNEYWNWNGHS